MRRFLTLLLLTAIPGWCVGPSITQSTKYSSGTGSSSAVAFTLTSSPTPGNILFAFISYSQFSIVRTITPPAGTWTKSDTLTVNTVSVDVYWHLITAGDGTGWTFNISGASADFASGVLYEISGANTAAPLDKHTIVAVNGSTLTTTAATPSVLNDLPLSCVATENGAGQGQSVVSMSAGWTLDQSAIPTYHPTFTAEHTITTNTTTAISNTFTMNYPFDGNAVAMLELIAPASTSSNAGSFTSIF